jgi:single-strand DNA-binding protein
MSQGGYVTLVGFVAREPNLRNTKDNISVADMRIGTTARYLDRANDLWRDGETNYYSVTCWRRLADNVRASLHKGDPVIVKGKFRTRTYTDREGTVKTEAEIVADTVGHDLSRGTANFLRPQRVRSEAATELESGELARAAMDADSADDRADDRADDGSDMDELYGFADRAERTEADDTGEEPMGGGGTGTPPLADPGSGGRRFTEEKIDNFTQGLDDDDAMARELDKSEKTEEPALPF